MKAPYSVIRSLQVTEKGTRLRTAENKFFFEVDSSATKRMIKDAVEKLFKVTVTKVNTMNYLGKRKRNRSWRYGKRSDWKRAIVTLKTGQAIDLE
jgi:large subunit ribosomal protein L23